MRLDTEEFEREGFAILPPVCSIERIEALIQAMETSCQEESRKQQTRVFSLRNLGTIPIVCELARSAEIRRWAELILGTNCFAVRGILFDKTPEANWKVLWHQDITIAVQKRKETAGFQNWSHKVGVTHVQPPAALLERMLTVRLHLDDCGLMCGPLRVLPGSHQKGRLNAEAIETLRASQPEVPCPVSRGGLLLMRPLLLHASSASETPSHRRVIHLDFAAEDLPGDLKWHTRF